jgi:hypothetical protein
MRAVVSTIEFDVTGKRVFVVGPVFLGPISSQTAMTLDPDGQALAPARPRCRHFFALESSRCLLLKLLLLLGADLIRMYLIRLDQIGHRCVLQGFAFTPASILRL